MIEGSQLLSVLLAEINLGREIEPHSYQRHQWRLPEYDDGCLKEQEHFNTSQVKGRIGLMEDLIMAGLRSVARNNKATRLYTANNEYLTGTNTFMICQSC